jgi:hypothetical protein
VRSSLPPKVRCCHEPWDNRALRSAGAAQAPASCRHFPPRPRPYRHFPLRRVSVPRSLQRARPTSRATRRRAQPTSLDYTSVRRRVQGLRAPRARDPA